MGKKSLTPFLISRLEAGNRSTLQWIDRKAKLFKITWKHAAGRNWLPKDGEIYKEYAIHAQKFVEGRGEREQYPRWKQLLRNALMKSNDFELHDSTQKHIHIYKYRGELPERVAAPASNPEHRNQMPSECLTPPAEGCFGTAGSNGPDVESVDVGSVFEEYVVVGHVGGVVEGVVVEGVVGGVVEGVVGGVVGGVDGSAVPVSPSLDGSPQCSPTSVPSTSSPASADATGLSPDLEDIDDLFQPILPPLAVGSPVNSSRMDTNTTIDFEQYSQIMSDEFGMNPAVPCSSTVPSSCTVPCSSTVPWPLSTQHPLTRDQVDSSESSPYSQQLGTGLSESQISLQSQVRMSSNQQDNLLDELSDDNNAVLKSVENTLQISKVQYCGISANVTGSTRNPVRFHKKGRLPRGEYSADGCELIELPIAEDFVGDPTKRREQQTILNKLANGFRVDCHKGNIFVTNNSKDETHSGVKIYCTSEQQTNTLLLPNKKIEVFSTEQLCATMCKHPGITPSTEVFLSVARKWNLKEAQSRARLLITINSAYAATYIQMAIQNKSSSLALSSFASDLANSLPSTTVPTTIKEVNDEVSPSTTEL